MVVELYVYIRVVSDVDILRKVGLNWSDATFELRGPSATSAGIYIYYNIKFPRLSSCNNVES
jgi:hypothetical protein